MTTEPKNIEHWPAAAVIAREALFGFTRKFATSELAGVANPIPLNNLIGRLSCGAAEAIREAFDKHGSAMDLKPNNAFNESIRDVVREHAREMLDEALENGDVFDMADKLREGIRRGWMAALRDIDAPEELIQKLARLDA